MENIAEWVATIATILAALMTAANLGARVTGWGFAMFTLGSAAWITADLTGGSQSKPPRDALRAPGRQPVRRVALAGSPEALRGQQRARVQAQPLGAGADAVFGRLAHRRNGSGKRRGPGTVVDAMLKCGDKHLAYVVTSEGGIGGAGETLRAVPPEHLRFEKNEVVCDLSEEEWRRPAADRKRPLAGGGAFHGPLTPLLQVRGCHAQARSSYRSIDLAVARCPRIAAVDAGARHRVRCTRHRRGDIRCPDIRDVVGRRTPGRSRRPTRSRARLDGGVDVA